MSALPQAIPGIDTADDVRVVLYQKGRMVHAPLSSVLATLTNVSGNLDVDGNLNVDGTANIEGATVIDDTLNVTGAADFDGNVNIDGTLNVEGATTVDDTLDVTGAFTSPGIDDNATAERIQISDTEITANVLLDLTSGQIKFPATQNPSSDQNTLDDYERNTWTPALTFGGGSTGLTYSTRTGSYVKVGRVVVTSCDVTLSAKGSSTGSAVVTGLPFTVGASGAVIWAYWDNFAAMANHPTGLATGTSLSLYTGGGATTIAAQTHANFNNNSRFILNCIYIASA